MLGGAGDDKKRPPQRRVGLARDKDGATADRVERVRDDRRWLVLLLPIARLRNLRNEPLEGEGHTDVRRADTDCGFALSAIEASSGNATGTSHETSGNENDASTCTRSSFRVTAAWSGRMPTRRFTEGDARMAGCLSVNEKPEPPGHTRHPLRVSRAQGQLVDDREVDHRRDSEPCEVLTSSTTDMKGSTRPAVPGSGSRHHPSVRFPFH